MQLGLAARKKTRPSLIPLIDVMLVLLFFFMLASSYVGYSRTPLQLAAAGGASGANNEPDVVRAVLLADGQVRVGGTLMGASEAVQKLKTAKDVRLSPAPGVALQTLLAGWEQLAAAGIKVQLAEGAP